MHIIRTNILGERQIAGEFKNVTMPQVYGIMYRMAVREQALLRRAGLRPLIAHYNKQAYDAGRAEVKVIDGKGGTYARFSQVWPIGKKTDPAITQVTTAASGTTPLQLLA